jgi:Vitamin K-dependent gamma-carboxylase.
MTSSSAQSAAVSKSLWQRWVAFLTSPIDGASFAAYRIIFGITFAIDMGSYFLTSWLKETYVTPEFNYSYIPFIQPPPEPLLYFVYYLCVVSAVLIALGLYYRAAAVTFCILHSYIFLLDRAEFLNHEYLISLTSFLLAIAPANNVFSLDRYFNPEKFGSETIPRWNLLIIKIQLVIVYLYGALWKISPDWLRGIPCEQFMTANPALRFFAPFSLDPLFPKFLSYGGILVDGLVPIFLCIPQTFWCAVALALPFHLMNAVLFNIGVFPFYMLGTLALFPPHNWPRNFVAKCRSLRAKFRPAAQQSKEVVVSTADEVRKQIASVTPQAVTAGKWSTVAMLIFFHVYLVIQLVVPLRHLAYEDNVDWTEEGYYFAWRMMLHMKYSDIVMYEINPNTGVRQKIDVKKYLNKRQLEVLSRRPEIAHHFAEWYADKVEKETGVRPAVKAKCIATLHNRPWQDLIDPRVDLASQPFNLEKKSWIMPLGNAEIVDLPFYQQRLWYRNMSMSMQKAQLKRAKLASQSSGVNP